MSGKNIKMIIDTKSAVQKQERNTTQSYRLLKFNGRQEWQQGMFMGLNVK